MVRVVVVGGGVNGVGTALALLQEVPQCQVSIISENYTPDTTGDGAAGLWGPYLIKGTPEHKILSWGQETWNLFRDWWKSGQNWGVSLVPGTVISREYLPPEPWRHIPLAYKTLTQEEYTKYGPEYSSGYQYTALVAESSRFLPKLMTEVEEHGGILERRCLSSLEDAASQADLIINCSGLGARDLVPDKAVYPCRGQVLRVRAPWTNCFLCDDSEEKFGYIIPNIDTVVLGGTHQDDDWRREVDPKDTETIWQNCTELMSSLKQCELVREWVGLRPTRRTGIRLEADEIKADGRTIPVVHNYGHGGCGVSTFWGCSKEAAGIAVDLIHKQYGPTSKL